MLVGIWLVPENAQMIDNILIFCLAIIATLVVIRLLRKKSAWKLIIAYWVVLTLKNYANLFGIA